MAFYSCPYTYINGRVCGKKCYRKEGCHIHWKRQTRIPCSECGTPTASSYGICMKHVRKYYSKINYYKNKLQDKKRDQASRVIQKYVRD